MAKRALRFGIRDDPDHRSATWKLWTDGATGKSDAYLASRSLGGSLKASLHQSGNWHYAHSPRSFEDRVKGVVPTLPTRFVETWRRPAEIAPGVTLAFRILTPSSAVVSMPLHRAASAIVWLPNAPASKATEIDILITSPTARVTDWPGKRSMNTAFVGSIPLANGETVWAVHRVVEMPDLSKLLPQGVARFYRGASKKDLQGGGIRALAFSKEPDGSRVFYDFAVTVTRAKAGNDAA